jgi:hypothetical protein
MPDASEKIVTIKFSDCQGLPLYHISGAWGGRAPDGTVLLWVFMDHPAMPEQHVLTANTDTQEVSLDTGPSDPHHVVINRRFLCGLAMQPEKAEEIGQWLLQHAAGPTPNETQVSSCRVRAQSSFADS